MNKIVLLPLTLAIFSFFRSEASVERDYIGLQKSDVCYSDIKKMVLGIKSKPDQYQIEVDAEYGYYYKVNTSLFLPFIEFRKTYYGVLHFDANSCEVQEPHKVETSIRRLASQ